MIYANYLRVWLWKFVTPKFCHYLGFWCNFLLYILTRLILKIKDETLVLWKNNWSNPCKTLSSQPSTKQLLWQSVVCDYDYFSLLSSCYILSLPTSPPLFCSLTGLYAWTIFINSQHSYFFFHYVYPLVLGVLETSEITFITVRA